jgi:hypothetical protein
MAKRGRLFYLPPSFTLETIIRIAEHTVKEMGFKGEDEELHGAIKMFAEYVCGIERHEVIKLMRKCKTVEEAIDLIKQRG